MNTIDVSSLDADAHRLSATWDKMFNFAASFGREFRRMRETFPKNLAPDKWGVAWDFERWMLLKVGPSEKTALRMLEILDKSVSSAEREKDRERMAEIRAQQKAEAAKRKAEEHAAKLARAAEWQKKQAAAQSPKERKAEAKKDREMHAKAKAAVVNVRAPVKLRAILTTTPPAGNGAKANGTDPFETKLHAARREVARVNELWVAAVMNLAMVMAQIRARYPDNTAFGNWLILHGFDFEKNDRAALVKMGQMNQQVLRQRLETTTRRSFDYFWRGVQEDSRFPEETGRHAGA